MNRPAHVSSDEIERRFPRRLLLTVPGAIGIVGVSDALSAGAAAAPGKTPWRLGGNTVAANGRNWIGTKNPAPLIVKTTAQQGGTPAERMRVQPNGRVGIGTAAPGSRLEVKGAATNGGVVRAVHTGNGAAAGAFRGIAKKSGGFGGWFSGRGGGVWAQGVGNSTQGVFATGTYGVRAVGTDIGVRGTGPIGVQAIGQGNDSYGLRASGDEYGVYAEGFYAVYGSGEIGTYGYGNQYGLYALSGSTGIFSDGNPAGYFDGDINVTGVVQRTAAETRIDHPLDPENRWLTHAGVESPDRKSVYDGTVVLDDDGEATVTLPAYVSKLNADFRYQLTCIGGHAPVFVAREIHEGRFRIAGGTAGLKVSWQVTGVRRDDYSRAHPLEVETAKTGDERGTRMFVPAGSGAKRMPTGRMRRHGKMVDPRTVSRLA
jgi:hypothetical protein